MDEEIFRAELASILVVVESPFRVGWRIPRRLVRCRHTACGVDYHRSRRAEHRCYVYVIPSRATGTFAMSGDRRQRARYVHGSATWSLMNGGILWLVASRIWIARASRDALWALSLWIRKLLLISAGDQNGLKEDAAMGLLLRIFLFF